MSPTGWKFINFQPQYDLSNLPRLNAFFVLNPLMKLRQNGIVSFSIKLAAFQASVDAEPRTLNPEPLTCERLPHFINNRPDDGFVFQ
jgi:hypothetical protein